MRNILCTVQTTENEVREKGEKDTGKLDQSARKAQQDYIKAS
jgi:hypothetical protein